MLYVSRYVGGDKVGVVDTDDGVEEVLTEEKLWDIVRSLHIQVVGCEKWEDSGRGYDYIYVYQPAETISVQQTKAKAILGVDIKMHNGAIANVHIDWDGIKSPVTLRLSDFGVVCLDHIFAMNDDYYSDLSVTFVLDDKLKIGKDTFSHSSAFELGFESPRVDDIGIVVDLSEITNDAVAEMVWRSLYWREALDQYEFDIFCEHVKDKPDRAKRIKSTLGCAVW